MRTGYLLSVTIVFAASIAHKTFTPWEAIHQTIHTYPLAIDFKNAPLFAKVFTSDAVANYTGPLSSLTGINAIAEALIASVTGLATQHQLGSVLIDIDSRCDKVANSTTYFTANLVSLKSAPAGDFSVLFGLYRDELVETEKGWRIKKRQLEFMTPNLGNLTMD